MWKEEKKYKVKVLPIASGMGLEDYFLLLMVQNEDREIRAAYLLYWSFRLAIATTVVTMIFGFPFSCGSSLYNL